MVIASAYKVRFAWSRASRPCTLSGKRGERGQTLVEAVLGMVILLTVLFGIIQCSLALYSYHFIADAAREGARYAVVRGSACTPTVAGACPASAANIQSYVKGLNFPGIDTSAAAMTVTVTWCTPVGSVPPACTAGTNDPGQIVRVAIQYKFPLAIPFVPANTITMKSASQMVIEQ